jgi:hypothetical protein
VPSCRIKKDKPEEEEWEQLPLELQEETRPWWVEHRELQATLSRHLDDLEDAPGQRWRLCTCWQPRHQ